MWKAFKATCGVLLALGIAAAFIVAFVLTAMSLPSERPGTPGTFGGYKTIGGEPVP